MKHIKRIILMLCGAGIVMFIFLYTHQPNPLRPIKDSVSDVDYDLSELSGNIVYSQVYAMMTNPEDYVDQTIRISGIFAVSTSPSGEPMYGCIILDALGCCQQGIQFHWKGNHRYPEDYPKLGDTITVTGTFAYQIEGNTIYLILDEADLRAA